MCKRPVWLFLVVVGLSACSSGVDETLSSVTDDNSVASKTISGSVKGALGAAKSPLVDLNFTSDEIPEYLQSISGNPYTIPSPLQCKVVKSELVELDTLLGGDMEPAAKGTEEKTDYIAEGASMIQGAAIGFVANKVDILPFRGVIRSITGANKQAKLYARAYESGKLRRAYLKGLNSALKCDRSLLVKNKKPAVVLAKKESESL